MVSIRLPMPLGRATLWRSLAKHSLEAGYDIRTIQDLLGRRDGLDDDDLCPCLEARRPRGSASAGCGAVSCVWLGARVSERAWVGIAG